VSVSKSAKGPDAATQHRGTKQRRRRPLPTGHRARVFLPPATSVATTFPERYDETFLCMIDVEPHTLFAFWEIDEMDLEREQRVLSGPSELVIRVYDVTYIIFDGGNAHSHFDVVVEGKAHNWYIHPSVDGRSFIADIGLRGADGRFVVLARSNCVQMPRAGEAQEADTKWMYVEENPRKRQSVPEEMSVPSRYTGPSIPIPVSGLSGLTPQTLMASIGSEDVVAFYRALWRGASNPEKKQNHGQ